jgi:hypothetical protein
MKIERLLRRYEVTKSVDPLAPGGGKPPLIEPHQLNSKRWLDNYSRSLSPQTSTRKKPIC